MSVAMGETHGLDFLNLAMGETHGGNVYGDQPTPKGLNLVRGFSRWQMTFAPLRSTDILVGTFCPWISPTANEIPPLRGRG